MFESKDIFDQSLKTRNKLLYISFTFLFIILFKPKLNGFFGKFSITVQDNASLFPFLMIGIILFLIVKFVAQFHLSDSKVFAIEGSVFRLFEKIVFSLYVSNAKNKEVKISYVQEANKIIKENKSIQTPSYYNFENAGKKYLWLEIKKFYALFLVLMDFIFPVVLGFGTIVVIFCSRSDIVKIISN